MPDAYNRSGGEPMSLRTAAAYIRVSTDDQLEYSPDSQLAKIQEYARSHDLLLMADNIFMEEEGRSGRNASKRPQFQRMIAMAKESPKPFDVILVWKFSRFARNQEESIVYKSMLRQKCGIDVVSVSEPIIEGPFGSLIERIIEWMDEYYSIRLSGEVIRGMKERFERGGIVSIPSFGYLVENGNYVPDPETAPIVRQIFEWFTAGVTYREIAGRLNTMGVKSRRGNAMEVRTVKYILRNPVYIGKIRWSEGKKGWNVDSPDQIIIDGTHEPIIPVELWQAAEERTQELQLRYPKHTYQVTDPAMLQGIVKCSACGGSLMRAAGGSMQCINYCHGKCKTSHSIKASVLNEMVLSGLEESFRTANLIIVPRRKPEDDNEKILLEQQIKRERNKLERVKAAYEDGIDTLDEYKTKKERITALITDLEQRIAKLQEPKVINVEDFIKTHSHLLAELRDPQKSESDKNEILLGFVDQVVFNRATNSIKIRCYS